MFRKLKIRLVLINVVSLTIVLLMAFFGVYFLIGQGFNWQSYMLMNTIAKEERIMPPVGTLDANRILLGSFFAKVNTSGEIIEYSSEPRILKEDNVISGVNKGTEFTVILPVENDK